MDRQGHKLNFLNTVFSYIANYFSRVSSTFCSAARATSSGIMIPSILKEACMEVKICCLNDLFFIAFLDLLFIK